MVMEKLVRWIFGRAGIECDGTNPADPQIRDDRFYRRVALEGSIGLGESYMAGWWTCERVDLLIHRLLASGMTDIVPQFNDWWLRISDLFVDRQDRPHSLHVAHDHYDTDPGFFDGVLGRTNSYTCARWCSVDDLDAAQEQKMRLISRKAELKAGQTVLDIGCGWGGYLDYAVRNCGVQGVGLSISQTQIEYARGRYGNLPIEFREEDYRDFDGEADAAVSICMIEHVGPKHLREYFSRIRRALPSTGLFVLQCIISHTDFAKYDPWLEKHIFPGGNLVTTKRLRAAVDGIFHVLDEEFFGEDYVKTLRAWYENLLARRESIVASYGVEHFRKYEYYFQMCMGGFMSGRITVGQFVLSPSDRAGYVPVR